MKVRGVGCSKKAGLPSMTGKEVGARTVELRNFRASAKQSGSCAKYLLPVSPHQEICSRPESEELPAEQRVVQGWLKGLSAFTEKLFPRHDICFNCV